MLHNGTEFAGKKTKSCVMRKIICILFAMITLSVVSFAENCDIYRAGSGEWLYTIDGNDIYRAGSGEWLYTIDGNDIYRAGSGEWLYTIDGNDIYRAGSGEWLYTIQRQM